MSRPDAFHLAPQAFAAPFALRGGEAAHCAKVLRKRPGDIIRLFDGQGREGLFTITRLTKDRVDLEPQSLATHPRPSHGVWIAPGFSRSARRDMFLEKAVELGAAGMLFWQATRSQGRMPETAKEAWGTTLVSAAKQCGAVWLPEVMTVPGGAAGLAGYHPTRFSRRILLWEDADHTDRLTPDDLAAPGDILVALGPEGGLAEAEAAELGAAGFVPKSLGERILRWETAAMAVLSLALLAGPRDQN